MVTRVEDVHGGTGMRLADSPHCRSYILVVDSMSYMRHLESELAQAEGQTVTGNLKLVPRPRLHTNQNDPIHNNSFITIMFIIRRL